ncbi:zinc finger and SCAN domain-containing protein 30-like isoform X1 [Ambystoma mexicanum]|uniref:zinc finger and SCAN domain-containing protein 30-like isoform X1 n=1 Tax=Ambystoma mexicanum TaxID=8296 RepID=UPI0037E93FE8
MDQTLRRQKLETKGQESQTSVQDVKREPTNNPTAFHSDFEHVTAVPMLPEGQQAIRHAPLHPAKTRTVWKGLPFGIKEDFVHVKEEILEEPDDSEQRYREIFRRLVFPRGAHPQTVILQLQDLCNKWLKPHIRNSVEIVELIVLEQFIQILPVAARDWLSHRNTQSIDITVQLVENFFNEEFDNFQLHGGLETVRSNTLRKGEVEEELPESGHSSCWSWTHCSEKDECPLQGPLGGQEQWTHEDARPAPIRKRTEDGRQSGSSAIKEGKRPRHEHCDLRDEERTDQSLLENGPNLNLKEWTQKSEPPRISSGEGGAKEAKGQNQFDGDSASNGAEDSDVYGSGTGMPLVPPEAAPGVEPYHCTYICSECGKNFKSNAYLNIHKRIHTGAKPHKCTECGKTFNQKTELVLHQRMHTGERPFKCAECEKCFIRNSDLIVHRRLHTGERPYKCPQCEEAFIRSSLLTMHQKRYHKKELICGECKGVFFTSSQLVTHQASHRLYRPNVSSARGKGFSLMSQLAMHKRTQAGERPLACEQCGQGFNHRKALTAHQRTHSDLTK